MRNVTKLLKILQKCYKIIARTLIFFYVKCYESVTNVTKILQNCYENVTKSVKCYKIVTAPLQLCEKFHICDRNMLERSPYGRLFLWKGFHMQALSLGRTLICEPFSLEGFRRRPFRKIKPPSICSTFPLEGARQIVKNLTCQVCDFHTTTWQKNLWNFSQ